MVGGIATHVKTAGWREIAYRANTFIEVALLWRQADDSVLLRVIELASRVEFELRVRPENALDAFRHPYAYLPCRLLEPGWLLASATNTGPQAS